MNSATSSSPVPDGWSLAVVIPPRITKTMGMPMTFPTMTADVLTIRSVDGETKTDKAGIGPGDTSRPQSVASSAKTSALTKEERKDLVMNNKPYGILLSQRRVVQKMVKELEEEETTLSYTHVDALKKVLGTLALVTFPDHATAPELIKDTKILKVLDMLTNATMFSDDVAEPAKCLRARWLANDYAPRAINIGDDIDDSEPNTDEPIKQLIKHLMRGIRYTASSMKLQEGYPWKRSADIFGDNGLSVGDWWPYQLCALRDGAHGSRQGGIAGKIAEGAHSIVISVNSAYRDSDEGYSLIYSGTHGDAAQPRTDSTQKLITSMSRNKPVRVIRKGDPDNKKKWYPACGFRYDGLYLIKRAEKAEGIYRFFLERQPGQKSLEAVRKIPDRNHKMAWGKLTGFL